MSDIKLEAGCNKAGYWVKVDVLIEGTGCYIYSFNTMDLCNQFYVFVKDSYHLLTDRLPDQPEDRLRLFESGLERAYEALTGTVTEPVEHCYNCWSQYPDCVCPVEYRDYREPDEPYDPEEPFRSPEPVKYRSEPARPLAEEVARLTGKPYTGPVAPDKPDRAIPVAAGVYVVPPGPPLTGRWNPDAGKPVVREFCWVCEETHPVGSYPHKEDR